MVIVGLVQDAKYSQVKDKVPPLFFVPYGQDSGLGCAHFYVRTTLDPRRARAIPTVMEELDPNLPVERPEDDAPAGPATTSSWIA